MLLIILITIVCPEVIIANILQPNSNSSLDFRIVEGDDAKIGQFPWHARLIIGTTYAQESVCGGSLIANNWVVTAAHCTTVARKITIGLGSKNAYQHEFMTHSKQFYEHKNYNSHLLHNDISLIYLDKPAPSNYLIETIALPPSSENFIQSGDIVETCGFGAMEDASNKLPGKLLWLKVRIEPNEKCSKVFGIDAVTKSKICGESINPRQNICDGDSGGGLIVKKNGKNYLIGITSFGRARICTGAPAGYERISSHLDWITKIMNINE